MIKTFEEWCGEEGIKIEEVSANLLPTAYRVWGEECYYEAKEAELRAEVAESELERYTGLIKPLEDENARLKHRAEVAERAGRIIQRDMARVFDVSNPRVCELIANIWDLAKKQAEKELAEENDGKKEV